MPTKERYAEQSFENISLLFEQRVEWFADKIGPFASEFMTRSFKGNEGGRKERERERERKKKISVKRLDSDPKNLAAEK